MATPFFSLQQPSAVLRAQQPLSVVMLSQDAAGNPIDIHTGFIIQQAKAFPSGNLNSYSNPTDVSAVGTFTFSTTGVTWSLTQVQVESLLQTLQVLNLTVAVTLSNDSGTTQSLIAKINLSIDNVGVMI